MVENLGLAVGISTLPVVVPVIQLFPVLVTISLFPVARRYSHLLTLSASAPWSNPRFTARIVVISVILLEI